MDSVTSKYKEDDCFHPEGNHSNKDKDNSGSELQLLPNIYQKSSTHNSKFGNKIMPDTPGSNSKSVTEAEYDSNRSQIMYGDQDNSHIKKEKHKNKLQNTQFDTTTEYIDKLRFSIPLDKLYSVKDSCLYNSASAFCPVLVKIGDKLLKDQQNEITHPYLLQVWTVSGKLVFERHLTEPLFEWNMHGNYLVFQEATLENYKDSFYLLEMFENEECQIYSFELLPNKTKGSVNNIMQDVAQKLIESTAFTGISNQLEENIISKNIGIAQNHLLINRDRKIYYVPIQQIKEGRIEQNIERLKYFSIHENQNLKMIVDIGNLNTALLLTNRTNKKLQFFQLKQFGHVDKYDKYVDVQLTKLGLISSTKPKDSDSDEDDSITHDKVSDIAQIRYICALKDDKFSHTACVLRMNGTFEFYSNFNLVSVQKGMYCNQIETDNLNYFVQIRRLDDQFTELSIEIYQIRIDWGNNIGMTVAEKVFEVDDLQSDKEIKRRQKQFDKNRKSKQKLFMVQAFHRSIAKYFRLFTQFINYKTFMLVAHRQFITVFDLKNLHTMSFLLTFDDHVRLVAESRVSGNQTLDRVMVLLNNNKIQYIKAKDGAPIIDTTISNQIKDKICKVSQDQVYNSATYMLTQVCERRFSYTTMRQEGYNSFRRKMPVSVSEQYKLIAINQNLVQELLPYSDEQIDLGALEIELSAETQIKCFYQEEQTKLIISNSEQSVILVLNTDKDKDNSIVVQPNKRVLDHKLSDEDIPKRISKLKGGVTVLPGRLLGVFISDNEPEKNKYRAKFIARLTTEGIEVYNEEGRLQEYYTNPHMREMILVDNTYVYCLCEDSKETQQKFDLRRKTVGNARGAQISNQEHGLYVYDIGRLLQEGQVESYLLAPAIVGLSNYIDYSDFSQRVSYQTSFEKISMMPFPHRNTINFIGMGIKEEYLIWREKGGFFTGLHKSGELRIWSIGSGKFIGSKKKTDIPEENCPNKCNVPRLYKDYSIYKAHPEDTCYLYGYQNFENHTLQLMIKKEPDTLLHSQQSRKNKLVQESPFVNETGHTVQTSTQDLETYEFVVLRLTTNEDFDSEGKQSDLRVMILYRFKFQLGKSRPTLHISQDSMRLMEVINNKAAVIFIKDSDETLDDKLFHKWKKHARIHQYPSLLQGNITLPFLFDPKFEKYIDVDYSAGQIVIRSVDKKDSKEPIKIPQTLLGLKVYVKNEQNDNKAQNAMKILNQAGVARIAKRMHFVSKNLIRFINNEGIDLYYDIKLSKVVCFTKWDNLLSEKKHGELDRHLILDRAEIKFDDILTRLVRRCQEYKSAIEFEKYKLNSLDLVSLEKRELYRKPDLLSFVYKVNYSTSGANGFMAEMSFTLLDWIICERIQKDPLFDFNDIDRYQQVELCFNIFPNNMTMLHKLAVSADTAEDKQQASQSQSIDQVVQTLFSICKKGLTEKHDVYRSGQPFEIPIIQDINGQTALDIAFASEDQIDKIGLYRRLREVLNIFFKVRKDNIFKKDKSRLDWFSQTWKRSTKYLQKKVQRNARMLNSQLAVIIFSNISSYGYLQHSQLITDSIIKAIKIDLPGIGEYLDSRLSVSDHMPKSTQHALKNRPLVYMHQEDQYEGAIEASGDARWCETQYNALEMQIWDDKETIRKNLFSGEGVQKRMIMRYLDVPLLHLSSYDGFKFINALSDLKSLDNLEIYSKRSIQILINSHWQRQQWKLNVLLFCPFIVMLTVYCLWSNFTLHSYEDHGDVNEFDFDLQWARDGNIYFRAILSILAIFFLLIEGIKIVQHPIEYILNVWNWLGLPPLIMVLINANSEVGVIHSRQLWTIQSFTGLMMWMRCLYYLRGFEAFSYFIRMLIAIIKKIRIFFVILAIIICGFADTFHSLSEVNQEHYITSYVGSLKYSYNIVLGQFADEMNEQKGLNWLFFVMATLISMLILANLLIEIVSETYGEVTQKKYLYVFKERCELICDVQTISALLHQIYQTARFFFATTLKIVHYFTWKQYQPVNKFVIQQSKRQMLNKCELLIVAWEDPTHKETNAYDEDGDGFIDNSIEEKIDTLCQRMKVMSEQLGIDDESDDEGRTSISEISQKLDRLIDSLYPKNDVKKGDWQDHQCHDDIKVRVDPVSDVRSLSYKQQSSNNNISASDIDQEQRRREKDEKREKRRQRKAEKEK